MLEHSVIRGMLSSSLPLRDLGSLQKEVEMLWDTEGVCDAKDECHLDITELMHIWIYGGYGGKHRALTLWCQAGSQLDTATTLNQEATCNQDSFAEKN